MSKNKLMGVPSTLLLPAERKEWTFISGPHALEANISDMELGPVVEYKVAEDISTKVDLGNVTKALFNAGTYPELNKNEVFSIRFVLVDEDTGVVTVVGNVYKEE